MSIPIICTCGNHFQVPDQLLYLHTTCPACGTLQVVKGAPHATDRTAAPRGPVPRPPARTSNQDGLFWLVGTCALFVLLTGLAVSGFFFMELRHNHSSLPEPSAEVKVPPTIPAPPPSARDLLSRSLKLAGSVASDWRVESVGGVPYRYHQWLISLKLTNQTEGVIHLGDDLFLIESSGDGSSFEGAALFRGRPADPDLTVFSLFQTETDILDALGLSNYQIEFANGQTAYRKGNNLGITPLDPNARSRAEDASGFGRLARGESRTFKLTLEQGTMLNDELRQVLRLVLPELRIKTAAGEQRYRLLATFQFPTEEDRPWEYARHELIGLQQPELAGLIESAKTEPALRILAANWLVALDPKVAADPLRHSLQGQRPGKFLISGLKLLTRLQADGLGPRALELFKNATTPSDVRRVAAAYLGALHFEPALKPLIAAAADKDDVVARGAIDGLGSFPQPEAFDALLALFGDDKQQARWLLVALSLARSRQPEAQRTLQKVAGKGNRAALWALTEQASAAHFAFFVELAGKEQPADAYDLAVRGVRRCGREQAGPALLELLQKEEPPPAQPLQLSAAVRELILLNSPKSLPELIVLARQGNLRALQVLAGSPDEAARAPLTERAVAGQPVERLIALNGLASNWPRQSLAVFQTALTSDQPEVVVVAALGLARSNEPTAIPALLAVLKSPDSKVRGSVAAALESLPANRYTAQWLDALLATDDDQVARVMVNALIRDQWRDRSQLSRLADKLMSGRGDLRYQIIRLLRHLAGNPMGPKDYFEYQENADGWNKKWSEWAARQ